MAPTFAAAQSVPSDRVERAVTRRVAERVAAAVEQYYVVPDTGRMIAEHIRGRVHAGAYDVPLGAAQFADRLGADMRIVNGDRHLYLTFLGARAASPADGPRVVRRRPGDPPPPDQLLQARRLNHFVRSAERRASNVGYLSIAQVRARAGEAFGPDPVPTMTSYTRVNDPTTPRSTGRVNGRKTRRPLFVLVGPGTASGAEDLAFILEQSNRATLVGERTAGAGRLTRVYPIGDRFEVSVSGGRTYDPRSGAEWERVGVHPDITTPVEDAHVAAHAEALARPAASLLRSCGTTPGNTTPG